MLAVPITAEREFPPGLAPPPSIKKLLTAVPDDALGRLVPEVAGVVSVVTMTEPPDEPLVPGFVR
jgi:hypothetical protein